MLQINGKTFMNLQEAVQWLLDNNALPYQSTANYVANTEIGMGTIVNPSPAKVRIGSLIFFADSKVSTVIGLTQNGFICSDEYNNLVDDVAHVTGVSINASGHLITTFSDGQTQDAGLIKQVSSFSINASQHLIANYNDGTSTDLGAIFAGNIITTGYIEQGIANWSGAVNIDLHPNLASCILTKHYCRAQKINQKLSIVLNFSIENDTGSDISFNTATRIVSLYNSLPADIASKVYDMLGKTVAEISSPDQVLIAMARVFVFDGVDLLSGSPVQRDFKFILANRAYANVFDIDVIGDGSSFTFENGHTYYFTGRITLDLL